MTELKIPVFKTHPGGIDLLSHAATKSDGEKEVLVLSYHIGCDWSKIAKYQEKYAHGSKIRSFIPNGSNANRKVHMELDAKVRSIKKEFWYDDYVYFVWIMLCSVFTPLSIVYLLLSPSIFSCIVCVFWNMLYNFHVFHMRNHGHNLFKV